MELEETQRKAEQAKAEATKAVHALETFIDEITAGQGINRESAEQVRKDVIEHLEFALSLVKAHEL